MKSAVAIIDSGGANIASLLLAMERLGVPAELTTNPERLRAASHVILPGVGAAADCMGRLRQAKLTETIRAIDAKIAETGAANDIRPPPRPPLTPGGRSAGGRAPARRRRSAP